MVVDGSRSAGSSSHMVRDETVVQASRNLSSVVTPAWTGRELGSSVTFTCSYELNDPDNWKVIFVLWRHSEYAEGHGVIWRTIIDNQLNAALVNEAEAGSRTEGRASVSSPDAESMRRSHAITVTSLGESDEGRFVCELSLVDFSNGRINIFNDGTLEVCRK